MSDARGDDWCKTALREAKGEFLIQSGDEWRKGGMNNAKQKWMTPSGNVWCKAVMSNPKRKIKGGDEWWIKLEKHDAKQCDEWSKTEMSYAKQWRVEYSDQEIDNFERISYEELNY